MQTQAIRDNLFTSPDSDGKLIAHRCNTCGHYFFPREAALCLECLSTDLVDTELSGRGTLHSHTTSNIRSRNLRAPYTCGYVDLEEGLRIFCIMDPEEDSNRVHTGERVVIKIGELWRKDDTIVIGYLFRIANGEENG